MHSQSYNNSTVSTRNFQSRGNNHFTMSDGLQGVDLEFAKTTLVIGRSLSRLTSALQRQGLNNQAIGTEIKNRLRLEPGFAAQCVRISRAYRPEENEADGFEFYYLIAIPHEVLLEFLQHIIQYFKDPTQGIGPNMWVSKKSIEIYIALETGPPQWWDLKFLTTEHVKALPTLVSQIGPPPQQQASNSYGQSGSSYQASHPPNGGQDRDDDIDPLSASEELSMEESFKQYYRERLRSTPQNPDTQSIGNRPEYKL